MDHNKHLPEDWKDVITWECIIDGIISCKDRTCGGKPPTLRSRIKGHGDNYWIFKRAKNGGYPQLLTDKLKPLFNLLEMGATRFWANFAIKLQGKTSKDKISEYTVEKSKDLVEYLVFPESKGTILNRIENWKDDPRIILDYLIIGMFRWGSVRATDFNGTNILLLKNNKLLSIDETEIENRKTILSTNDKKINKAMIDNKDSLITVCRKWAAGIEKKEILKVVRISGYDDKKADWIMNNIKNLERNVVDEIKKLKSLCEIKNTVKNMNLEEILTPVLVKYKYRVGKTFHEFYISSVKSALQKSIRRGNVNDAIAYGLELWLFVNDKENPSGGDGVVTNLINRLHIIASEDIGMGNPLLVEKLQPFFSNLDKPKNYVGVYDKRKTPLALKNILTIIQELCLSKHSRLISLLITPYCKPHYFKKLKKQFPKLYDTPDIHIKDHSVGFINAIDFNSPTAVYHAAYFYINETNFYKKNDFNQVPILFPGKRKYEKIYWIWEQLLLKSKHLIVHETIIELCKLYEKKHTERKVYLVHAIALIILYKNFSIKPIKEYSTEESLILLNNHINSKMDEIPDIYKDMHTIEGMLKGFKKKSKKGIESFIADGMHIENPVIHDFSEYDISEKNLLDCYVWSKLNLDVQ